jgi:sugar phosphate isomerase/epimerase
LARTIYAMDTSFYTSLGAYDFEARCEMLKELGYDATYLTLWSDDAWADVPRLATVRERHGLEVTAVYVTLDIANEPDDPANRRILELVDTIEGCRTIELSVRSSDPELPLSDPRGDEAARRWLSVLLERAERRGTTIALYPHIRFWMERMEDAVRLCRAVDHPLLRMVFPTYHWYAADGKGLAERVAEAAPYLVLANVCGSRRYDNGSGLPATIEPTGRRQPTLLASCRLAARARRGPRPDRGAGRAERPRSGDRSGATAATRRRPGPPPAHARR